MLERRAMKKAVHRAKTAERWALENPEKPPDERFLSLAYHWKAIMAEEEAKKKKKR